MSQGLAQRLQLQGVAIPIAIKTFGKKSHSHQAVRVEVMAYDIHGRHVGVIEAKVVPEFADVRAVSWVDNVKNFPYLSDIEVPVPFVGGECELLLGNNCARLIAPLEVRVLDRNNVPVAHRTRLGWSVAGPSKAIEDSPWAGEAAALLERKTLDQLHHVGANLL